MCTFRFPLFLLAIASAGVFVALSAARQDLNVAETAETLEYFAKEEPADLEAHVADQLNDLLRMIRPHVAPKHAVVQYDKAHQPPNARRGTTPGVPGNGGSGTKSGERAVAAGLSWLANHQQEDGSWSFAHRVRHCDESCDHEGARSDLRNGPTALVLLSYLGASQSHVSRGPYQKRIADGWNYLLAQKKESKKGDISYADFSQGNAQTQSLCTLVLCETLHDTKDDDTRKLAQAALNQLLRAPIEFDDGWRWLALHSAKLNGLEIAEPAPVASSQFLAGSLQLRPTDERGVLRQRKLVALGLLGQVIEGWREKDVFVESAAKSVSDAGIVGEDIDHQYFATIALFNQGYNRGPAWDIWHRKLRKQLVESQAKAGHVAGSWYFGDDSAANTGGRLYCTVMAINSIEIYYRYLSVYKAIAPLEVQQEY